MDQRAALPVSLPVPHSTTSYWQTPPSAAIADYLSADIVPEEVDVCIIGSGITGAGVAWNWLKDNNIRPAARGQGSVSDGNEGGKGEERRKEKIIMLEARQTCSGATGRNGGHTKAASYRTFPHHVSQFGIAEAVKIARLEYDTIRTVHQFAREKGIACDSWEGDTLDVFYSASEFAAAHAGVAAVREAFRGERDDEGVARYKFWTKEEVRDIWGVKGEETMGGLSYAAGSLHPYKFVMGVLGLCLDKGLELYTHTPARRLYREEEGGRWVVETTRGTVRARKVVLCTNGYTASLEPRFQGGIVPMRGQVSLQYPPTSLHASHGGLSGSKGPLNGSYSFIYTHGYEYMITRPPGSTDAGAVVIGGGLVHADDSGGGECEFGITDDTNLNGKVTRYLQDSTKRYFGGEDWKEKMEWTGIMGFSSDGCPFVGEVPVSASQHLQQSAPPDHNAPLEAPARASRARGDQKESDDGSNLYIAASFQGHGMVLCWLCAEALVGMMRSKEGGRDSEKGDLGWFPDVFLVSEERMGRRFGGRFS